MNDIKVNNINEKIINQINEAIVRLGKANGNTYNYSDFAREDIQKAIGILETIKIFLE